MTPVHNNLFSLLVNDAEYKKEMNLEQKISFTYDAKLKKLNIELKIYLCRIPIKTAHQWKVGLQHVLGKYFLRIQTLYVFIIEAMLMTDFREVDTTETIEYNGRLVRT